MVPPKSHGRRRASARTAAVVATMVLGAGATVMAASSPSSADSPMMTAYVGFTAGAGSELFGDTTTGSVVPGAHQPDGASFPVECWAAGDPVTNDQGYTSSTWLRTPGSVYLPESLAQTGSYGIPAGVPSCTTLDRGIDISVGAPYIWHQSGAKYVKYVGKVYVSKAETLASYRAMESLNTTNDRIACNVTGIGIGVAAGSYGGPVGAGVGAVVMIVAQTLAGDIMCNTMAGMTSTADVEATLQGIVDRDECAVIDGWTDGQDRWVASEITSTGDPFLCA